MASEFTSFEIRFVIKQMSTRTDAEIASALDRNSADISDLIRQLTGGRSQAQKAADKKSKADAQDKLRKKAGKPKKLTYNAEEALRSMRRRKMVEPQFETKQVDLAKLVSVRIDKKTCIYIKPGEDPVKAKEKYLERLRAAKSRMIASEKTYHEVKKFKPVS